MGRTILFQIHWFLGITAGLVLAVMGVTGATISFQDEIMTALNRGVMTVEASSQPKLTPPELAARFLDANPGAKITRIVVRSDPNRSARISYTPENGHERKSSYIDPKSGRLLGEPVGEGFFQTMEHLHRWLALPGNGNGIGRQITGIAAISLIYFALSGLYLRWPKKPLDWRSWFVLDLRKTGRNLYRALHAVIGGWVLIFYLISGFTGLYWSYSWYRDGMRAILVGEVQDNGTHGGTAENRRGAKPDDTESANLLDTKTVIANDWRAFEQAAPSKTYEQITVSFRDNGQAQFRAKLPNGRHDRVSDEVVVDGKTGKIISVEPYALRPLGKDIMTSVYEIHRGAYFGIIGRLGIMFASLTMPLFTVTGFLLYFARRKSKRALVQARAEQAGVDDVPVSDDAKTLVVFASQTGSAERLARLTALALPDAAVISLHQLEMARLAEVEQLFVVASTYGEGDPPDMARSFARRMDKEHLDLSHVRYAVLALGDKEYPDFCAFGHRLDQWLHAQKAERLFDLVEMDGQDADAQRQWQQQLSGLGACTDMAEWASAPMEEWRLVERRLLNPGSSGEGAYHIALHPPVSGTQWQAGDILEIMPRQDHRRIEAFAQRVGVNLNDELTEYLSTRAIPMEGEEIPAIDTLRPLAHREYSIASISASGRLDLIVRRCNARDGLPGLGSGWLTQGAQIGSVIEGRVRENPSFHAPEDISVPLVLIGNGTGLSGLLSHIRQRESAGGGAVWLFWGERDPDHDAFHSEELARLVDAGVIARFDCAWSRIGEGRAYVQDKLRANAEDLAQFIASGAAIYVCGSINGMAPAVNDALAEIIGETALEEMAEAGRYRRDIY